MLCPSQPETDTMRIRITIEYDTDETLAYEEQAWREGNVALPDFLALIEPSGDMPGDDTITVRFETIVT